MIVDHRESLQIPNDLKFHYRLVLWFFLVSWASQLASVLSQAISNQEQVE